MTREFLENFKVGDQQLPAEIIDAILAENGRDVAELESVRTQLKTAEDGLAAFQGVDVQELQGKITALQNDLKDAKDKHAAEVADMAFNHTLESAIAGVKGRSVKAILGELGAEIARGAVEAGMSPESIRVTGGADTYTATAEFLRSILREGDHVLFKASRSMALETLANALFA